MKAVKLFLIATAIAALFSACGGKAKNKITLEEAKAGRDRELFLEAIKEIDKGNFDTGRILINTMINTYPDSPLARAAKLANADSFYLQGGSKNLAQAEVEYRDWVEFFPDDALADDIYIKMAEIHLRQVLAHNRDISHARFAEQRLKEMMRRYPNSDRKEEVEQLMVKVQEILAMHELEVARFNYVLRRAAQGAQIRTEEILNKYPNFSRLDEALWIHARSMIDQEDTETASRDLTRLVANYPHSEFRQKAEALLKEWGKPVPEPDPAKVAEGPPQGKGLMSRTFGFFFGPKIDTSPKGVIIDRDLKPEEIAAHAQELVGLPTPAGLTTPSAGTTTNTDSRPRRAAGATQDVEVKPADKESSSKEKPASKDNKKDDKKDKDKKKPDNSSKVLRNP